MMSGQASASGWPERLPELPAIDHAQFGAVEQRTLPRHQQVAARFLERNWVRIPHVTHHDEACIDALEAHRNARAGADGRRPSLLPYLIRAAVASLQAFPKLNASLEPDGKTLTLKRYYHIGVAVSLEDGLVVPVLRDCDRKSLDALEAELADKAERARSKGLPIAEMQGGCFSISSLGGFGGTGFTPIINAPELAVMGVSRAQPRLRLIDGAPRETQILPLSLSYDHRVVNGADAARFTRHFAEQLEAPGGLDGD